MKKITRIAAVALIAAMLLSISGASLAEEVAQSAALATFDGEPITLSEVQSELYYLISSDYLYDETDYETALDYLIQDRVRWAKVQELGLDQFTAEEEEAFLAEAQAEWDAAVDYYVSQYLAEDTEEARAQAREDGDAYLRALGYSVEGVADELKRYASYDLLDEKVLEDRDITVTAEEIKDVFDQYAQMQIQQYGSDVGLYEMYQLYGLMNFWFIPDGYRGITHILLSVDEDILNAYHSAQAAYEESVTDENPEGDPALLSARDEALAAVLASRQPQINDIYARLENGESFESLIAVYGSDPGMQDAANLQNGYAVHANSVQYDSAFTAGAFSEKMQQPGDTSDPVVSQSGIHILHYLRDIPGGPIEMTDEINAIIEEYLYNEKLSDVFGEIMEEWKTNHEIVYNEEVIAAAKAQAAEAQEE